MARRRNYKRDRNGRFARTGGSTRKPISRRTKTAAKLGLSAALVATAGYKAGPAGIRSASAYLGKRNVKRARNIDVSWLRDL